ncbi:hypothetical protein L6304_02400 [bacterium]|nr:hypothetical protein [bacterium]
MKTISKVFLTLILIVITYQAFNYFTSEERKLKIIINRGKEAIEREDLGKCMRYISQDYSDEYDQTYQSIKEGAKEAFEKYDEINIWTRKREIVLKDSEAEVTLGIILSAESLETGLIKGQEKFTLYFRKENGHWRIIKASPLKIR